MEEAIAYKGAGFISSVDSIARIPGKSMVAFADPDAANMIPVVNKMDRTALSNVPEQKEVIYKDLKRVTTPYDPKDLYLSFLDTTAYFDTLGEDDAELKAELFELSGHDTFVDNLNRFVAAKGVLQKINLPLNIIAAEIRNASAGLTPAEKADLEAYVQTVRKRKDIFVEGKDDCLTEVKELVRNCKGAIKRYGLEVAESVLTQTKDEDAKKVMENAKEHLTEIAAEYAAQIDACTKNFIDKKIKAVEAQTAKEKLKSAKLSELLTRTENLIGEIQACK